MADKKYETGIETRKLILAECRKLFLDKGFHETSYNDICKAAHVNRGSIYYHFKQKDMIRYEILWEIYTDNKRIAEQYTSVPHHQYVFSLYLMWRQILTDSKLGRFLTDYYTDYPVYVPQKDLPVFITTLYKNSFDELLPLSDIDEFTMASMYGYIGVVSQMVKAAPERFPLNTLFGILCSAVSIFCVFLRKKPGSFVRIWNNVLQVFVKTTPLIIYDNQQKYSSCPLLSVYKSCNTHRLFILPSFLL